MSTLTLNKPTGIACALAALVAMPFVAFAPQDQEGAAATKSINFDLRPEAGLKIAVKGKMTVALDGTMSQGEMEHTFKQSMAESQNYTQKFTEVKENKITKVERTYEESTVKTKLEIEVLPEPQESENENPVAWKSYRADMSGEDEIKLEVKDGDEWTAAAGPAKKQLTRRRLESPLMPLPKGTKQVGESWEFSGKELKDYFQDPGSDEEGMDVEMDGTGTFELAEIKPIYGVMCGVIKFKLQLGMDIQSGITAKMVISGTAIYNIKHRVYTEVKLEGTMNAEGEPEESEGGSLQMKGKVAQKATAKVVTDE